jgi:hypothetical protein
MLVKYVRLWIEATEKALVAIDLLADKGLIMEGLIRVLSMAVFLCKEERVKKGRKSFENLYIYLALYVLPGRFSHHMNYFL